jgi:hypothetical protein
MHADHRRRLAASRVGMVPPGTVVTVPNRVVHVDAGKGHVMTVEPDEFIPGVTHDIDGYRW